MEKAQTVEKDKESYRKMYWEREVLDIWEQLYICARAEPAEPAGTAGQGFQDSQRRPRASIRFHTEGNAIQAFHIMKHKHWTFFHWIITLYARHGSPACTKRLGVGGSLFAA